MGTLLKKTIYITFIMNSVVYSTTSLDPIPGDPIWPLTARMGTTAHAIDGNVTRIRNEDIGVSGIILAEPGAYAVVEPITYNGIGPAPAITIASSNVVVNLNDFTIHSNNASVTPIIQVNSNLHNVTIKNGSCINNNSAPNAILIANNCHDIRITNLCCQSTTSHAIALASNTNRCYISAIQTKDAGESGIYATSSRNLSLRDCNDDSSLHGLTLENCSASTITGFNTCNSQSTAMVLDASDAITISKSTIRNAGLYGIALLNSQAKEQQNICIDTLTIINTASSALFASESSTNVVFENCTISESAQHGICFENEASNIICNAITIVNTNNDAIICGESAKTLLLKNITIKQALTNGITIGANAQQINIHDVDIKNFTLQAIQCGSNTSDTSLQKITISDGSIAAAITFDTDCTRILLDTITISDTTQGIVFNSDNTNVSLKNCLVQDTSNSAYSFGIANNEITLSKCSSQSCGQAAFNFLGNNKNITISECSAYVCTNGYRFNTDVTNLFIKESIASDCSSHGIVINTPQYCILDRCLIQNCITGIQMQTANDPDVPVEGLVITDCILLNNALRGLYLFAESIFDGAIICNNSIINSPTAMDIAIRHAIVSDNFLATHGAFNAQSKGLVLQQGGGEPGGRNTINNNIALFFGINYLEVDQTNEPNSYYGNSAYTAEAGNNYDFNGDHASNPNRVTINDASATPVTNRPRARWQNIRTKFG